MNASDTYFDLNDYEVQQSLALALFDNYDADRESLSITLRGGF